MSQNCGHQQVYCSSPRYMKLESHSGMMLTGETEELGNKPVLVPLGSATYSY
jgi:hypothetical protein